MRIQSVRDIRKTLSLSRSELARFLGVSEATIVRWESGRAVTEPRGLQAVLISALIDATTKHSPAAVARVVRSCGWDHRDGLKTLLDFSEEDGAPRGLDHAGPSAQKR